MTNAAVQSARIVFSRDETPDPFDQHRHRFANTFRD
jgi:hypothetical protein